MTNETKIELLMRMIEKCDREYEQIIEKYGHGVRPSFVSADLADIGIRSRRYQDEIDRLMNEVEDDGFITVRPKVR